MSVEGLTCTEEEKNVFRRIIESDRTCDVVRSDGRRERGIVMDIEQDGRIVVAVKGSDGEHMTTKRPRVETFLSWQETTEGG